MPKLTIRTTTNLSKLLVMGRVLSLARSPQLKEVVVNIVQANIEQNFASEADPEGTPWAPLSPYTLRYGRGTKKLQATGACQRSIKVSIQGDKIVVRFVGYMKFHQRGTRKMPKRQFAPVRSNFKTGQLGQEIRVAVQRFLTAHR
jgi:phage gpG-like protein